MKSLLLVTSMAIISLFAQADSTSISAIDTAANHMNVKSLQSLAQQGDDYQQAYAGYRLAISANILGQRDLAISALESAKDTLEPLTASSANADNLALLSSVYGMLIGLDNSKGAEYGAKAGATIAQAKALDPANPRVPLVQAIAAFNTPEMYGGSKQGAIDLSSKAIELYAIPCDNICWGHAEAYTWRGLAKQNLGDVDGAIADWQQALVVESDYSWAQFLLQQNGQSAQR
jgi:tetratricopeptide (TPR) repeat protein